MNKKQQMRWNRATVQPFLDVRTAVLNDTLEDTFRHRHRHLRLPAPQQCPRRDDSRSVITPPHDFECSPCNTLTPTCSSAWSDSR